MTLVVCFLSFHYVLVYLLNFHYVLVYLLNYEFVDVWFLSQLYLKLGPGFNSILVPPLIVGVDGWPAAPAQRTRRGQWLGMPVTYAARGGPGGST